MSDMIFYFNPMSRARVAHWMLKGMGAKYDYRPSNQRANELAQKLLGP